MQIFKTHKHVDIDKSIGNVKITSTHYGRPIENSDKWECLHRIDNIRSFIGSKEYTSNDEKCIRNIEVLKTIITALEEYLSSKKKNGNDDWIPVEERLPSDEIGEVLTQNRQEYMLIGYFSYNENMGWYECESDEALLTDVVAWQPLPKPYRPKEQNDGK